MNRIVGIAAVVALGLFIAQVALAAGATATATIRWEVQPFAVLSLAGKTGRNSVIATTPIPLPGPADYQRGFVEMPEAVRLTVLSNTQWTVFVQALDPNLGTSTDGRFTWPLEALSVGVDGRFVSVSWGPQALIRGGRGAHTVSVDYRITLPDGPLPPGDYRVTLLYTVTTD